MIVVLVTSVCSGCRLAQNAWLTAVVEPLQYSRNLDDKLAHNRFRKMATVALEEARALARAERDEYECEPFSDDHEQGFVDGFAEYLSAGGTGQPPPLPPRKYWRGRFQNPIGQQQILDWYDGYRHGVAAAQVGDHRSFVVVPLSDSPVLETQQRTFGRIVAGGDTAKTKGNPPTVASVSPRYADESVAALTTTISRLPPVSTPSPSRAKTGGP